MKCPYCESESNVVDSRVTTDGVRRRRHCPSCKRRFTPYERLGPPALKVTKRDGKNEPFTTEKIEKLLARVCRDRKHVGKKDMRRLARDIEAELVDARVKSVPSNQVADMVLVRLADVDKLSYDRLASNYIREDGQLRTDSATAPIDDGQLGLFAGDDDD